MIKTKTQIAKDLWNNGEREKSLSLFARFRFGVSKEENRVLTIARDILHGHMRFYQKIGIDTEKVVIDAYKIIEIKVRGF